MNLSFYTAAVGANQQQQRLNVQSNNLANVNTNGFKGTQPSFASLMYGNIQGMNGQNLPRGTGSRMILNNTDFKIGPVNQNGYTYDYAIMGDGFFGLYDPVTTETSYTRDGSFMLSNYERPNEDGVMESAYILSDGDGRFVLGQDGEPLEVDPSDTSLPIAVYNFDNTNGMLHIGKNRFMPIEKNGPPQLVEGATVQQGFLEASNVDLATELSKVIEAQRSYSFALRMVQTSDEVESTINGLRG